MPILSTDKLRIEKGEKEGSGIVLLKGIIDEDSNFSTLLKVTPPLRLDFSGVTAINSCGVRNWVNFLKEAHHSEIIYRSCPPLIVRQMNMVPSFVGTAKVDSVYVPYVCEECDTEKTLLTTLMDFKAGKVPLSIPCETCKKGEMEFDGQPKQYFAFSK